MIAHLYNALHSPLGIIIETDNPERVRARFYSTRTKLSDPKLDCLSLVQSPTNTAQLWIVKRVEDEKEGV